MRTTQKWGWGAAILVIATLAIGGYVWCANAAKKPIRIGFIGGLSGRIADLGGHGRDGALLAIEEQNDKGGINGRPVIFIAKDDGQDPKTAAKVMRELIQEEVVAIIGPMTSSMAEVCVPIANKNRLLMVSPTVSTTDLTGKDDYFYRVYPHCAQSSRQLARHVYEKMNLKRTCAIYDVTNRAHTESAFREFRGEFESLGGVISGTETFTSGPDITFMEIAKRIAAQKPDCIYILANAVDSAMLCQQLSKLKLKTQIVSTDWSATDDIIQLGGKTVEGLFFIHTVDRACKIPRYAEFRKAYKGRFTHEPGFASIHGYDAARILLRALAEKDEPAKLKATIQRLKKFEGVQSAISFDEYGDVIRKHFPSQIKNGRFVVGDE
jgi:branched-chain amino acid transport system substrate-binding protein